MPCPNCDHTMECLHMRLFWCPRCGTVLNEKCGLPSTYTPKLVEHCREYETHLTNTCALHIREWNSTGMRESIHLPRGRMPLPVTGGDHAPADTR